MKQKNKKGFTLIELLVTISILGIIMALTLPAINRLQHQNNDTKYKTYQKSMLTSAKLYTDSYTKDMFGNNESGCYEISYDELKTSNLLKDIQVNNVNCASNRTFIRVYKANDYNRYESSISCQDSKGKIVYKDFKASEESCNNIPDKEGPTITISPNGTTNYVKSQKVKVTVSDTYGLLENVTIQYAWKTDPTAKISSGDYTSVNFKNKRYDTSVDIELNTPPNVSGNYYLVINPEQVRDSLGNHQSEKKISSVFKLDNEEPNYNTSSLSSTNSTFQSLSARLNMAATDNITAPEKLKIYVSNTGYQEQGKWEEYNVSKNWLLGGSYDGSNRKVYVSLKDLAGNIANKTFTYSVYKQCSKTSVSYGNYGSCSVSCGTGKKTRIKSVKDTYLNTSCGNNSQETASCDTGINCCSSTKTTGSWKNSGSCSKTCGGGKQTQLIQKVSTYDNSSCGTTSRTIDCNTQSCCSSTKTTGTWKNSGSCSKTCGGGKQTQLIQKVSTYDNSSCGTTSRTIDCNTQSCCKGPTTTYSDWSSCSDTCDNRKKTRKKTVKQCDGTKKTTTETKECAAKKCSVECYKKCPTKKDCRQTTYIHSAPNYSNLSNIGELPTAGTFYIVSTLGEFYYGVGYGLKYVPGGTTMGNITGYVYSSCLNDTGIWCPDVACKG